MRAALFGVVLLSLACAGQPSVAKTEEVPKYTPATTDHGKVHRVWKWKGDQDPLYPVSEGQMLVAAEISLPPPKDGKFDLDDVDIFDADTGENHGSDPALQRMNARGEFVDDNDPEVKDDASWRGVFVWEIPATVRHVNFGYWGDMLFVKPSAIDAKGPDLPHPRAGVDAFEAAADGTSVALFVAHDWSRVHTPKSYTLHATGVPEKQAICEQAAWLEIDGKGQPRTTPLIARPYYEGERRFLVSFRCAQGATPDALNLFGTHAALPSPAPLQIPEGARKALAAVRPSAR